MRSCSLCKYAQPMITASAEPAMECHRYPPLILLIDDELTSLLPQVFESDWCGEWTR